MLARNKNKGMYTKMSKKTKIFKLVLLGVVLAIAIAVTAYLIPVIKELGTPEGQQAFQARINDSGFLGVFIYDFVSKEKIEKIENSKLFQNPKTIRFLIFILFFIPGTPKDLLTYIAALLPIKPMEFIIISTIARFPSVISSTWAGASLLDKITDEAIRTIK